MLGPSAELAGVIVPEAARPVRSGWSVAKGRIASALCLLPALYCAGVVLFALSHAPDYATALPQLLRYIIVPALIALGLTIVAVRASRLTRVNVGGVACGLLLAFFMTEAVLEMRYVASIKAMLTATTVEQPSGLNGNRALPPGWTVKRLNREIGTTELRHAVLSNPPHTTVNLCLRNGYPVSYKTGRFGFRNPESAFTSRPELMLVGDSFVEGICLPDGLDLAGQVRRRTNSLLSLGTRGAGPLLELAMLGRYGPAIRPKLAVIAFYEGNDWENLATELRLPWLRQALANDADFGPTTLTPETARRSREQIERWNRQGAPDFSEVLARTNIKRNFLALHQTWTQLGLGYPTAARRIPEYDRILQRYREIAGKWGGRVVIAYIPQNTRYIGLLPRDFVFDELRDMVRDSAATQNIPFIDLTPVYSAQKNPLDVYGENHLTPAGASLSADVLVRELRKLERGGRSS